MIFNGYNGYRSGDLSRPNGTVIATMRGPVAGRNKFSTGNPSYSIVVSPGATGTVALQGTNDTAIQSARGDGLELGLEALDGATWTNIQTATNTTQSGTFAIDYQILRLVIVATGTGVVAQAWVSWS